MAEMRALIFELRPESLEQEGLVAALTKQAEALRARYRLEVALDLGAEPAVSLAVKEALYRIGQEALHNVVRHAQARHVWVTLHTTDHWLTLTIRDDGSGFDPAADFPGHLGLVSMRERVERLAGSFALTSTPDQGTEIRVTLPPG
jgi:signal transduction histidine kinase